MALQISEWEYSGQRADCIGCGHVAVTGDGVSAMFSFGRSIDCKTKQEAMRQASLFVAAMEFVDRMIVEAAQ